MKIPNFIGLLVALLLLASLLLQACCCRYAVGICDVPVVSAAAVGPAVSSAISVANISAVTGILTAAD